MPASAILVVLTNTEGTVAMAEARLARRLDFTLDLVSGRSTQAPLEQVAALLTQLAQQFVIDELVRLDLRTILTGGVAPIRDRIAAGLAGEPALADLGHALEVGGRSERQSSSGLIVATGTGATGW